MELSDSDSASAQGRAEEPVPVARQASDAETWYISNGNDKRTLIALSVGCDDEIDPDTAPWNTIPRRDVKPRKKDLQSEVKRRSENEINPPRPNNWDVNTCMEWLKLHPVTANADLSFIKEESSRIQKILDEANREAAMNESLTRVGQWRGPVPILRLAHCLIEDDIKTSFLRRNDARSRRELDGRNSADRPLNAYELIAAKWNDPTFNPRSLILNCHPDFEASIDISHGAVVDLADATAAKVEDLLTTVRTLLIRLITDWERSGQGEGGHANVAGEDIDFEAIPTVSTIPDAVYEQNDAEFGSLCNRSRPALACRRNFLNGKPSYLLYFWELMEKHQLLSSTVQRLDDSFAATDANSVPTVRSSSSKRARRSSDEDVEALQSVSSAIVGLAKQQALDRKERRKEIQAGKKERHRDRLNHLRDTLRDYRRYRAEARSRRDNDMVLFYNEEITALEEDIAGEEMQLLSQGTPQSNTSQSNDGANGEDPFTTP